MRKIILFSISIISIILMSSSCGSNIAPIKIDPCESYDSLPPKILVYENLEDSSYLIDKTFFAGNSITFKCSKKCDTYYWQLGTDDRRWTTKDVSFNFGYITKYTGPIKVKLITFNSQDTICNKNDDGRDTIIQDYQVEDPITTPSTIFGTFIGTSTLSPKDTLEIRIFKWKNEYPAIFGLPTSLCNESSFNFTPETLISHGWRSLWIAKYPGGPLNSGPCLDLCGKGWMEDSNKVIIKYNIPKPELIHPEKPENRLFGVFTGIRKNK